MLILKPCGCKQLNRNHKPESSFIHTGVKSGSDFYQVVRFVNLVKPIWLKCCICPFFFPQFYDQIIDYELIKLSYHHLPSWFQSWWCHQMETFSASLALCEGNSLVTDKLPSQRLVMQSFNVFFDLCLHKRLCKQSRCRWFEMPLSSLWRHCNVASTGQPWQLSDSN